MLCLPLKKAGHNLFARAKNEGEVALREVARFEFLSDKVTGCSCGSIRLHSISPSVRVANESDCHERRVAFVVE